MSDHRYIKTLVVLNKSERGSGYWKINVSHLENQEYILKRYDQHFQCTRKLPGHCFNVGNFRV